MDRDREEEWKGIEWKRGDRESGKGGKNEWEGNQRAVQGEKGYVS